MRGNGGGNMWPMLAGVGPILGEGDLGAFVDGHGNRQAWSHVDGKALFLDVPTGGAYVYVTEAVAEDRTGRMYSGSLLPDQPTPADPVSQGNLSSPDRTLHAAAAWLQSQPGCNR